MKNNRIEINTEYKNDIEFIKFYLIHPTGSYYLFQKEFSKGVYFYFRSGRAVNELYEYKYKKNKCLNKIVSETLPIFIDYVLKYEVAA